MREDEVLQHRLRKKEIFDPPMDSRHLQAGPLPLIDVDISTNFSSSTYIAFPNELNSFEIAFRSQVDKLEVQHHTVIPSPIIDGVLGIL